MVYGLYVYPEGDCRASARVLEGKPGEIAVLNPVDDGGALWDSYRDDLSPVDQPRSESLSENDTAEARNSALIRMRSYSELLSPLYYGVAFVETGEIALSEPASRRLGSAFSASASGLEPKMLIQPDMVVGSDSLVPQPAITDNSPRIDEVVFGRLTWVAQIDQTIVYHISNGRNGILAVLMPDQKDAIYEVCSQGKG